jgi:hypothetical protein
MITGHACGIAMYVIRFQDKTRPHSLPDKHVATLTLLVGERDMYVADKTKYQGQLTDQNDSRARKTTLPNAGVSMH